jgi:hypothetical protein
LVLWTACRKTTIVRLVYAWRALEQQCLQHCYGKVRPPDRIISTADTWAIYTKSH